MKAFSCIVLVAVLAAALGSEEFKTYDISEAPALFEQYIKDYNKVYKSPADRDVHYQQFLKTLKAINEHNSDPKATFSIGLNNFADFTEEEMYPYTHGLGKPGEGPQV